MRFWRTFFGAMAAMVVWAAPAWAGKRVAFVIGNSAYLNAGALANPANDASDVAAKLRELGFEVTLGLDLDKRTFDSKLRDFSVQLESADAALVFYAGHGLQIAGRNYLIPVDARLERERDVEFEAVSLDFVLKQMELNRDAKTNIIVLDACRNNPLARNLARSMGTRSANVGSGLAETFAGVGTFISYSTQPGKVALDGEGRNSPFASAFLKRVAGPGRSLTTVMIDVRKDVVAATQGKQVPWDHSALTGEFYFDPNAKAEDTSEMQGRIRQLEDEVKSKSNVAANATLTQLKQRVTQMKDESRRDQQRVFDLQRSQFDQKDSQKLGAMYQEIGRVQIGIVRRGKDIQELNAEIARVEESLGIKADAASGTARTVGPADSATEAKADTQPATPEPATAEPETAAPEKPASITPPPAPAPATTASVTPAPAEAEAPPSTTKPAAAAAKAAVKSKKPLQHRKPKITSDSDWNRKPLGP